MGDKREFPSLVTATPDNQPATAFGGWTPERTRSLNQGLPLTSEQHFPSIADPTTVSGASGSELWPPTSGTAGEMKVGELGGSERGNNRKDEESKKRGPGKRGKKWKPLQL